MDVPDDWNQEYNLELYRDTFDAAITFAKKYPDTLWCYGNHDLSYLWNKRGERLQPGGCIYGGEEADELACAAAGGERDPLRPEDRPGPLLPWRDPGLFCEKCCA